MTEGIVDRTVAARPWISNRDFENLNLVASVDGTSASEPIRQSLDEYFDALGGVSKLNTIDQAIVWADNLRAEGRFPDVSMPTVLRDGNRVRVNLDVSIVAGLAGLALSYGKNTDGDLESLIQIHHRATAPGTAKTSLAPIIGRSISEDELGKAVLLIESSFTSQAFNTYLDHRAQSGNFVATMVYARLLKIGRLPWKQPPAGIHPWEAITAPGALAGYY